MTITIVCDVLGEENNGTTVAAMNLIRFLQRKGHNVKIVCADKDKIGMQNYFVTPCLNFGKILNQYVAKVGVTIAKADDSILREAVSGSDVVHCMLPFFLGTNALKIAKEMGIPVSAGFHMQAENLTSYFKLNKISIANNDVYKFIYNHFYKYVDKIHYPTSFIQNIFETSIRKKTPGVVVSNGVSDMVQKYDCEKPQEFKDKILILSTGRYSREKSQDTLIKAIGCSKYKDKIQLILAGQGLKEKKYKKLAESLPIKPIFKFFDRKEVIDVLNYSDIYVHPAENELEGIACLEAICCGKLTIVSDSKLSATKAFAVSDKCVFKNRNYKDLARVIDYFIENPKEKTKLEKLYYEKHDDFNQGRCLERMENMFLDLIEKNKKQKSLN